MLSRPSECSGCSLHEGVSYKGTKYQARGFSQPVGPRNADILIVGEALGKDEAFAGEGFVGPAGQKLNSLLGRAGLDRQDCRISNTIWCQPPNDWLNGAPYEREAINHCAVHRKGVLDEPHKVTITVGSTATRTILGLPKEGFNLENWHGTVSPRPDGKGWVVPMFHPSFLLRGQHKFTGTCIYDLSVASELVSGGRGTTDPGRLVVDPPIEWFSKWVDSHCFQPDLWLAVDIETPGKLSELDEGELEYDSTKSNILRVNFSNNPGLGITIPWEGRYIEQAARLLKESPVLVMWNERYDNPILQRDLAQRQLRVPSLQPRTLDFMWGWHVLQSDLPKGLGFVAPFYCLAAGDRVVLTNGKTEKISNIVTKKLDVPVLGMNEVGEPVELKVKNWFRADYPEGKWLEIRVSNTKQAIHCTPEHNVWVRGIDGVSRKRLAANVIPMLDKIVIPRRGDNSLIHGTLLGDGNAKDGQLRVSHCKADSQYVKDKARAFPTLGQRGDPKLAWRKPKSSLITHPQDQLTLSVSIGPEWEKTFYPNGKKIFVPPPDHAAIAIWYCDDGSLAKTGETYTPKIYVGAFDDRAVLAWAELLYGEGNCSIYNKGPHQAVAFKGIAREAFFKNVAPWVPPSMERKLPPEYRGLYNGWLEPRFQHGRVLSVEDWTPPKWHRRKNIKYCIEVDHPTHRFFVNGGLVSNSTWGAWKHLSGPEPGRYAAIDAIQTIRCAFGITEDLKQNGQWDVFRRHIHEMDTYVLRPAEEVGLLVDQGELQSFKASLQAKEEALVEVIRDLTPEEANLKQVTRLKRKPKDLDGIREVTVEDYTQQCQTCKEADVSKKHRCRDPDGKPSKTLKPEIKTVEIPVTRWERIEIRPFMPSSDDDIRRYMELKGIKGKKGKKSKTNKASTDEKALEAAYKKTKDPFFKKILEFRSIAKVLGTYVEGIEKRLGKDGRIHAHFGHHPSTLRLSCRNPNLTNVVGDKDGDESPAAGFRRSIIAQM